MIYDLPSRCHKCSFSGDSNVFSKVYDTPALKVPYANILKKHYYEEHDMTFVCPFCSEERWFPRDLGCHIVRKHNAVWERMESHFTTKNKFLAFASGTHERLGAQSPLLGLPGDVMKLIHGLWEKTRYKWYEEMEISLWGYYRSNDHQSYLKEVEEKQLEFLKSRDMVRFLEC